MLHVKNYDLPQVCRGKNKYRSSPKEVFFDIALRNTGTKILEKYL